jgi:alcohol dehydrogenase
MAAADTNSVNPAGPRLGPEWNLAPFEQSSGTRLIFGPGTVRRIGKVVAGEGAGRVLLVTDPGLMRAGHAEAVRALLLEHVREVAVFDATRENPDTECVDRCLAVARAFGPDAIVGLGGGSAMDTGKGCNFLFTNGGRMADYWGVGKARRPMLPFFAVPTTAGTGSECQSAALIADAETHVKMACLDAKALARVAILDPELTLSMPPRVTACAGIDALAHAVETAVCSRRTALSGMYSREAFRLLVHGLPRVLRMAGDLEARGRMLWGAALAGCAIEASMLGAAHSAANPLTARFGVVHGVAVGLMLPHVVRFNAASPQVRAAYAELVAGAGLLGVAPVPAFEDPVETLIRRVEELLDLAGMPSSLPEAGVDPEAIPALATEAARQWTAGFNPREVSANDFELLYRAASLPRRSRV